MHRFGKLIRQRAWLFVRPLPSQSAVVLSNTRLSALLSVSRRNLHACPPRWANHLESSHMDLSLDPITEKATEWFEDGVNKWNEGDIHAAVDSFQKSVLTKPTADAHFNLGLCWASLTKYGKAEKSWLSSLNLDPTRYDVHVNLANIYAHSPDLRNLDKSVSHFEAALRLAPEDGEIRFDFGVILDSMGKLEEAIEQYKLAQQYGVDRASVNLRNAQARLLGKKLKEMDDQKTK
ncbi:hypothetical protein BJ742DRAFT_831883 [Cladochytrium replicatum]|nr:hypothetical protein BJ742DRAFT_831883 [Cladochytrium replicatum]